MLDNRREPIAAVFLLRDDGAALLQHRDDKPELTHAGKWVPPGGHCEPGEPIEACARREFLEETGYKCVTLNPLTSYIDVDENGRAPEHLTVFWDRYDGVQPVACYEGQAVEFVERHRASTYAMPNYILELWDLALAAAGFEAQPPKPGRSGQIDVAGRDG
jgi:8-oxo-dGTP pyrophosphatase MutT (NUDIX family)